MKRTKKNINNQGELLLTKAHKIVTHQLIGGVALTVMGLMIFNTMNLVQAANTGASNLNMTVGAGSLAITNVGSDVEIGNATAGTAGTTEGILNDLVVSDYRDVANYCFDVNIHSDPLTGVDNASFTIPNTNLYAYSDDAEYKNINTFDNTKIAPAENGTDLSGDNTFLNANNGRTGAVQVDAFNFGVYANADLDPQVYRGDATITVIAG